MEWLLALFVPVAGGTFLFGRRIYLARRDAALSESAGSALWIRSTGARADTVSRLTMQLARALAADADAPLEAGEGPMTARGHGSR
ncbi:MAG: hypothetical protein R2708_12975 [Vicinamibacterales bacterium]